VDSCTLCEARFSLDQSVTDREINHGITPCKLIPDGFYLEQNDNLAPCDFDASCFIQVTKFPWFRKLNFHKGRICQHSSEDQMPRRKYEVSETSHFSIRWGVPSTSANQPKTPTRKIRCWKSMLHDLSNWWKLRRFFVRLNWKWPQLPFTFTYWAQIKLAL